MKYRRFGRTNWQVSEVGYGMWGMAGWTASDDAQSATSLDVAVANGVNFFDNASITFSLSCISSSSKKSILRRQYK